MVTQSLLVTLAEGPAGRGGREGEEGLSYAGTGDLELEAGRGASREIITQHTDPTEPKGGRGREGRGSS